MRKTISGILLLTLLLSGCWDKTELNERAYVNGIAIDKAQKENTKEAGGSELSGEKRFLVSVAVSDLKAFDGAESSGEKEVKNKNIKKSVGQTVSAAIRFSETYSSQVLYLGHTKTVFFGEELLRDKKLFKEALDALQRDSTLSRKTLVLVTEGDAAKVISVKPEGEPSIGVFADNFYKSSHSDITFKMTMEDLFIKLRNGGNVVIPKIKENDGELVIGGGAVIKDFTLCGFLNEEEIRGCLWQKDIKGAIVIVEHNGVATPFTVKNHKSKVRFYESSGAPVMRVNVNVSGSVNEYIFGDELFDEKIIADIEESVSTQIKEEIEHSNDKLWNELHADAMDISGQLKKKNYKLWHKYGHDRAFEQMKTDIQVNAEIKSVGLIN